MTKEKLRVLLVEDNPIDAMIVKKILQRDNAFEYEVVHLVSGEDALLKLENWPYDIMLLDYNLPKKNGLETRPSLKAQ